MGILFQHIHKLNYYSSWFILITSYINISLLRIFSIMNYIKYDRNIYKFSSLSSITYFVKEQILKVHIFKKLLRFCSLKDFDTLYKNSEFCSGRWSPTFTVLAIIKNMFQIRNDREERGTLNDTLKWSIRALSHYKIIFWPFNIMGHIFNNNFCNKILVFIPL